MIGNLHGVPILQGVRGQGRGWKVWCEPCSQWHWHGASEGSEVTHRVAHCAKGPYKATGYFVAAPTSDEVCTHSNRSRCRHAPPKLVTTRRIEEALEFVRVRRDAYAEMASTGASREQLDEFEAEALAAIYVEIQRTKAVLEEHAE